MFNPQQFAHKLKNSTLTPAAQLALLDLLPSLNNEQIDEIATVLLQNNIEQENILKQVQLKLDIAEKEAKEQLAMINK
jgi:hypothetical protein